MLALARLGPEPDAQAVRHAIVRHPSGLSVLAAPATAMPFEAFDAKRIASILDALAAEHDVVIVYAVEQWFQCLCRGGHTGIWRLCLFGFGRREKSPSKDEPRSSCKYER